jgi:hypothetical protein
MWDLVLLADFLTLVSSSLKMEVTCSSETSVDFQWTTWCYIPEERILQLFAIHLSFVLTYSATEGLNRSPYYTLYLPLMSYSK